jgi:hypothetical protein
MKKIAVLVSAWHFPLQPYKAIASQKLPEGWELHKFCISHRDPKYAIEEKKNKVIPEGRRGDLDRILYKEMATQEKLEALGWHYKEYPNTIGDWGNANQWLEDNNYKDYDLLLISHDDNLILHNRLFADIIEEPSFPEWEILSNTVGSPPGSLRGSFEFFKPSLLEKIGGKFDLSETTLTREGVTTATEEIGELYDWNSTVYPLQKFINDNQIPIAYLSPAYRVSAYCIEGERGYISNTHGANTVFEEEGLDHLVKHGVI